MNYKGTLIAVKDLEKAKKFYHDVLGLEVVNDFGANVMLTGDIYLQTADTWTEFIKKPVDEITFANNASELYFETDDMDSFAAKLSTISDVVYLHPMIEHTWGQRAVRFYDSDCHIIEVAENMVMVIKRFIDSGFTEEQTAERMDVDVKYIKATLEQ